jgi:hypothetical protein
MVVVLSPARPVRSGQPSGGRRSLCLLATLGLLAAPSLARAAFDTDGDGYCASPGGVDNNNDGDCDDAGETSALVDCDDARPSRYPGAPELCDLLDNDCSGAAGPDEVDEDSDGWMPCSGFVDEGFGLHGGGDCLDSPFDPTAAHTMPGIAWFDSATDCMTDVDGDHFGDSSPSAGVTPGTDCDDGDVNINPNASEGCDGIDGDCSGSVGADEIDDDGDGFVECSSWSGTDPTVAGGGDCDDTNFEFHPGAAEICDGLDTNCNGTVPANEVDQDGDGWVACPGWSGFNVTIVGGGDCDETDVDVSPGAAEECDGVDTDCTSGTPDDEVDDDGDG